MPKTRSSKPIRFDEKNLVPAIIRESGSGEVLMLGFMNQDALQKTFKTGQVHFFSRKRQELWHKGETSGNIFYVEEIRLDCDGDTLLITVQAVKEACHKGFHSCFFRVRNSDGSWKAETKGVLAGEFSGDILRQLQDVIQQRKVTAKTGHTRKPSYVAHLFNLGPEAISQKIDEESQELREALANSEKEAIIHETADLFFHVLVGISGAGVTIDSVKQELARRFGTSGIDEKAARSKKPFF